MKPTLAKPLLAKPTLANTALSFAEATQPAKASNNRVFHAPEGYRRLTINLPEEMHKKLRLAAIEQDCTATEIIERLLNKELS
jgi:hypothetical protein